MEMNVKFDGKSIKNGLVNGARVAGKAAAAVVVITAGTVVGVMLKETIGSEVKVVRNNSSQIINTVKYAFEDDEEDEI